MDSFKTASWKEISEERSPRGIAEGRFLLSQSFFHDRSLLFGFQCFFMIYEQHPPNIRSKVSLRWAALDRTLMTTCCNRKVTRKDERWKQSSGLSPGNLLFPIFQNFSIRLYLPGLFKRIKQ